MTEYAPVSGQDRNTFYSNPHIVTPHYNNGNGVNYFYPQGQLHYPAATGSYSSYAPTYMSSGHPNPTPHVYMSNGTSAGMPYSVAPPPRPHQPQPRSLSYPRYHSGTVPTQRSVGSHHLRRAYGPDPVLTTPNDIESQESVNENTMLSESIEPPLEGYPDVKAFDRLLNDYVKGLSSKKQDKALIGAKRARNIRIVLIDKKTTAVESAQFRFWVKKMFTLRQHGSGGLSICHESKPVAVREKLFKILTRAHKACQHGGRDKTSIQVRRVYSWVPKELISRFVKMCPTCKIRRPTQQEPEMAAEDKMELSDDECADSPIARGSPVTTYKREPGSIQPHIGFSSAFAQQNRWMTDLPNLKTKAEYDSPMMHDAYTGHELSGALSPHYSTRLSEQLNSMSFPSSEITSPTGFPSSNVRSTGNWQTVNSAYSPPYATKQERRDRIKKERHY